MNTEANANTRTRQFIRVMQFLAYMAFIGFAIEAGTFLFSFVISSFNPEVTKNLYQGQNLYMLRQSGFWQYTMAVYSLMALPLIKAVISYVVIKVLAQNADLMKSNDNLI